MFGENLKRVREEKGWTQQKLADESGVPVSTLRGYEQGQRSPTWEAVVSIAEALGVSLDVFREGR